MNLLGREVGLDQPIFLISGPSVIESEALQLRTDGPNACPLDRMETLLTLVELDRLVKERGFGEADL